MNKTLTELNNEPTIALIILLAVIIGLVFSGKLSSEAVDALKGIGMAYFGMHGLSNLMPTPAVTERARPAPGSVEGAE